MDLEELAPSEWEAALPDAGYEVFHRPEALDVLDSYATGDLRLYGGFKGDQPVALFPAFVRDGAVGRAVFSPPPGFGVPNLGPLVTPNSPKQRKHEQVNRRFVEALCEELAVDSRRTLFRTVCSDHYDDPRPFQWADLDVSTDFTYVLDVEGASADEVMGRFSSSLRRDVRNGLDLDLTVDQEGVEGAKRIYEETRARFEEHDDALPFSWAYVRDLVTALDERCRVYVVRDPAGDFLTGITVLYSNDAAYFWQGGARASYENVSVNSLLHWRIVEDLIEDPPIETVTRYDMVGANTPRLCKYKSKFGADLAPYYVVESDGAGMALAKTAYRAVTR